MDLNREYAAHQKALMSLKAAGSDADRHRHLVQAHKIAGEISAFQQGLGAAAACAWCASQLAPTPGT